MQIKTYKINYFAYHFYRNFSNFNTIGEQEKIICNYKFCLSY